MQSHSLHFFTEYYQFYVVDKSSPYKTDSDRFWTTEANEDRMAVEENLLGISVAKYAKIDVTVNLHDTKPKDNFESYDHIVEASIALPTGVLQIKNCTDNEIQLELRLTPGIYTVRSCSAQLSTVEGDEGNDFYVLDIYPSDTRERTVLKKFLPRFMIAQNKFIKQFEFEYWSNGLILKALRSLKQEDERAVTLFSHLLSSHCMWLSRVTKTTMTCTLFQERTLDECEHQMKENTKGWKTFLADKTTADLEEQIEFLAAWEQNPSKRKISIEDAIIHLINHSSYHRGQIVASIKDKIDELPLSTYIMYASEIID
jgi:uncharacterized damage-inducible protein DinB